MKRFIGLILALAVASAFLGYGITKEIPVGRVYGRVTMAENNRPLSNALVTLTPSDESHGDTPRVRFALTDDTGKFSMANVEAGDYEVEASAKEHSLSQETITVIEAGSKFLEVKMAPIERYLKLYTSRQVFTPAETPQVEVHGFVQEDKLRVVVHKLSLSAMSKYGGLDQTLNALTRPDGDAPAANPNSVSTVVSNTLNDVTRKNAEGAFVEPLPLPKLAEGFYWVQCRAGSQSGSAFLNITKIALVTKTDQKHTLAYVVDIDSGQPVPGAKILCSLKDKLNTEATTDVHGLATVGNPTSNKSGGVVAARAGESTALCRGVSHDRGEEDSPDGSGPKVEGTIFTYTDRPIYRPGDRVQFKSIVRLTKGTEYSLPKAGQAKVEIRDSDETLLQTMNVPITSHGTLHGEFTTSSEAKPGVYAVVVHAAGMVDHYWVNLAAYHKPDIKITTKAERDHYVMGDTVRVTVSAEYYFGGPVVGAKISGYVYRSSDWGYQFQQTDDAGDGSPEDGNPEPSDFQGGEYNQKIEAVTDAAGRATVEFATTTKDDPDSFATDYAYDCSMSVQDGPDRFAEADAKVHVSRGDFNLDVQTDPSIATVGQTVDVAIKTASYDAHHTPVVGQPIELKVGELRWTQHAEVFIPGQTLTGVTDQTGTAHIKLPVSREMSLSLRATAKDSGNRTIRADGYLYVEGSPAEGGEHQNRFTLKLDKHRYKLGDTATALVETSDPGGVALVTIEADKILSTQTVVLKSGSTVVHIALPKEASPNAVVSACYVHHEQFGQDTQNVVVKREDRKLSVQMTPDRPTAQPGETVAFRVHAADSTGKPVAADLSVGVVDESVYAIKSDSTDIMAGLFPSRNSMIDTEYSFQEVYLDGGDKAGGSVPIRSHFEDTAAWFPEVQTDALGNGVVSLKLPDNLTTWRATAVCVTDQTEAGMCTADVRSSKPIMVRVQAPSFLVATDHQSIPVAITNDTGKAESVHFRLDAGGVVLQQQPPSQLDLAIGETRSVPIEVAAGTSGQASLVARVWTDDGAKDGVESKFPVQPHGRLDISSQSAGVTGDASFTLERQTDADSTSGRLAITVTPSVLSGLYQSLNGLVAFPYGCVEQTMSRFLPAVMVTHVLREQHMARPDLEKRVPAITADGFARLAAMQHDDGGWGWWVYDGSDSFMTAWVLDGLARLKAEGVAISPSIRLKKALEWTKTHLAADVDEPTESRIYLMDAVAKFGKLTEDANHRRVLSAALHAKQAGDRVRLWALAALAAHDAKETDSIKPILTHLNSALDDDELIQPDFDDYSDERSALALSALTTIDPSNTRIAKLALRLTSKRGVDGWESTRATTFAVEGLLSYLQHTKEGSGPIDLAVSLNGSPLRSIHLAPGELDGPQLHILVPMSQLKVGKNELTVHRTGAGQSFVAGELRQYRQEAVLGEVLDETGISIDRQYYLLAPQELEDGTMKLMRTKIPVTRVKTGDIIECVLTIRSKKPRQYMFIEDPIPSNCRVTQRVDPSDNSQWSNWWCNISIFDDRVGLFATTMNSGTDTITYTMRAEGPGVSHALPTVVSNMYDPRQQGQGNETSLEVTQ